MPALGGRHSRVRRDFPGSRRRLRRWPPNGRQSFGATCRSVGEFSSSPLAQDHSDPVDVAGEGGEADR